MKKLICTLLFATPLFAQTVTGRFAPGEQYVEPERNAPAATSRMFVRTVNGQGIDLPATGQGGIIVVVNDREQKSGAKLRTPSGDSTSPNIQRFTVDAEGHEVLHIDKPIAGRYHVNGVHSGATVIAAEPDSKLTMTTTVGPLSRNAGDSITLHASLRDGEEAVANAQVIAHLTSPDGKEFDTIALRDKGNGEYEAVIDDVPSKATGFWSVRYDADGVSNHGIEFARTGSNQFMNERPTARLGMIHSKRDGDTLHVSVNAHVLESGRYRLDVIVAKRSGVGQALSLPMQALSLPGQAESLSYTRQAESLSYTGIAWGESELSLDAGAKTLSIDIPGVQENDLFLDVRLLDLDSMGVAGRVTSESAAR
ncbi:MAG TPA: hypothetical protein VJ901_02085 [Thermoanaerobaculia bacterium]|nr:hypothetical protein [Thermoanaerobaculia bacterium]